MAIASLLPILQIILAVLLVGGVLLQQRGAGLGSVFGGSDDTSFNTRRGSELFLFRATIVIGVLFALIAVLQLVL